MQRDLLLVREMIDAAEQARALLWNFTVLGEAANLVSEDTKIRFPEVPWRSPARLRNRVVHAYWSIDIGILHTTATEQLGDFALLLRSVEEKLQLDDETES